MPLCFPCINTTPLVFINILYTSWMNSLISDHLKVKHYFFAITLTFFVVLFGINQLFHLWLEIN